MAGLTISRDDTVDANPPGVEPQAGGARTTWWFLLFLAVGSVAFAARAYLLRFAGLAGEGNYDDSVHFSGALALVMGKLPYRDFLFLHPPMVLLSLAPFAGLAQLTSEGFGFSAARIAWMLLGAFNAIAVARLLRPLGMASALVGGLAYALYYPAAYAESTTMLEGLANTFLLASLLLLAGGRSRGRLVWAGIFLGFVPVVKIWGVVLLAAVLCWVWATRGGRAFLTVLLAAAASAAAVCLPFFIASPQRMWEMVVTAQLGRPDMTTSLADQRIWTMLGLSGQPATEGLAYVLGAVAVAVAAISLWRNRTSSLAWLAIALLVPAAGMLLATPSFFQHYPAVIAVPFALVLGAAVTVAPRLGHRPRWWGAVAVLPLVLAWGTAQAVHVADGHTGRDIEFSPLRAAVASVKGCVTSDDPVALIELDLVGRNIKRGCPVWIDLTGHSYIYDSGGVVARVDNRVFQHELITYLASGEVAIIGREETSHYLDAANRKLIKSWPVLASTGIYDAHRVIR